MQTVSSSQICWVPHFLLIYSRGLKYWYQLTTQLSESVLPTLVMSAIISLEPVNNAQTYTQHLLQGHFYSSKMCYVSPNECSQLVIENFQTPIFQSLCCIIYKARRFCQTNYPRDGSWLLFWRRWDEVGIKLLPVKRQNKWSKEEGRKRQSFNYVF